MKTFLRRQTEKCIDANKTYMLFIYSSLFGIDTDTYVKYCLNPVQLAAKKDSVKSLRWLCAHGADLNKQTRDFLNSPLMLSVENSAYRATDFLIDKNVNLDLVDLYGDNVITQMFKYFNPQKKLTYDTYQWRLITQLMNKNINPLLPGLNLLKKAENICDDETYKHLEYYVKWY